MAGWVRGILEPGQGAGRSRWAASRFGRVLFLACLAGSLLIPNIAAAEPSAVSWAGPDGSRAQFSSVADLEEFLRTADVVSLKELGKGTTRPKKALLEKDGVQLHAVFRTLDYYKRRWRSKQGLKMDFKDKYIFEVAAYELGKMLGMDNIPPVVVRKIDGKEGSLQVWVENAMNEDDRLAKKVNPPDGRRWLYQFQVMRLFDNLIYNDDRNQGNILIDPDWKIWLIDATRAFQTTPYLKDTSQLYFCERPLWEALQALTEAGMAERLEKPGYLSSREIGSILKRRDLIVEYFQKLIEEKGEAAVIVPGYLFAEPSPKATGVAGL